MPSELQLLIPIGIITEGVDEDERILPAIFLQTGTSKNRRYYSPEVVESFPGIVSKKIFLDHKPGPRSLRDLAATITECQFEGGAAVGHIKVLDNSAGREVWETYQSDPSLVEFSIWGEATKKRVGKVDGQAVELVEGFREVRVDVVTEASAGGRLVQEQMEQEAGEMAKIDEMTVEEFKEARPDLFEQMDKESAKAVKAASDAAAVKVIVPVELVEALAGGDRAKMLKVLTDNGLNAAKAGTVLDTLVRMLEAGTPTEEQFNEVIEGNGIDPQQAIKAFSALMAHSLTEAGDGGSDGGGGEGDGDGEGDVGLELQEIINASTKEAVAPLQKQIGDVLEENKHLRERVDRATEVGSQRDADAIFASVFKDSGLPGHIRTKVIRTVTGSADTPYSLDGFLKEDGELDEDKLKKSVKEEVKDWTETLSKIELQGAGSVREEADGEPDEDKALTDQMMEAVDELVGKPSEDPDKGAKSED